MVFKQGYFYWH